MRQYLWVSLLALVHTMGCSWIDSGVHEKQSIMIEAEDLRLIQAKTREMEGASGKVVGFEAAGDRAEGQIELPRGVYEVRLHLVSNSEHSDAVSMKLGPHQWRSFTWSYGELTESKPFVLTVLKAQTLPLIIEYAEPEILVDRIVIRPLLSRSEVAQLEFAALRAPSTRPVDTVIEVENMALTGTGAREFAGASGSVVGFDAEGARAEGKVMLDPGVYEVILDMVSQDVQNDGIFVDVGHTAYRTASWTYGQVGPSNPIVVTIPQLKHFPVTVRYAEPGVMADRVIFRPLLNAAVIAAHGEKAATQALN